MAEATVPLIIGVTGHRDLLKEEYEVIELRLREFFSLLQARFPDLPINVIGSLAEGADTLVAKVAMECGCKVTNVLPMPENLYTDDFAGAAKEEYMRLCAENETYTLPLLDGLTEDQVRDDKESRDLQYENLGSFLAAHSHILLALWDGRYNEATGGTGQVVEFHQRDVSSLADEDQIRSALDIAEDESDLVYHVVCSRDSSGAPDGLIPGDASWFTRDIVSSRTEALPERYERVFESMSQFNRDLKAMPGGQNLSTLEPSKVPSYAKLACGEVQAFYGRSDSLASQFQQRMLIALRTTLAATLLASLCFIVYADFNDQDVMIWGYFLFVGVAVGSYLVANRSSWQRRHLDYRVLAEALRVQYYWALSGVEMSNPSRYGHDVFFQGRDLELGWIRNVMRFTGMKSDIEPCRNEQALDLAIEYWVGDEQKGQLGYYQHRADEKLHQHNATQKLTALCFAGGLVAAMVLALGGAYLPSIVGNWLVALMGLLPIVAAVRQNYAHRLAERELVAQFQSMKAVLLSARQLIERTDDQRVKRRILLDLGEAALNETAQWVLRQRERPLPGGGSVG